MGTRELDDSGSLLLAYLIGKLPPSISAICFENVMTKKSVEALGIMLRRNQKTDLNLRGLAVTNSHHLTDVDFYPLFNLLIGECKDCSCCESSSDDDDDGGVGGSSSYEYDPKRIQFIPPALPLIWLDLSANKLSDKACAKILDVALSCGCSLESLDLSSNNIKGGSAFVKALSNFKASRKQLNVKNGGIKLRQLLLANNSLKLAVAIAILDTLNCDDGLELKILSLRSNQLSAHPSITSSLRNLLKRRSGLIELDLGGNLFNTDTTKNILFGLLENLDPTISLLKLDTNTPPISEKELFEISTALVRSRKSVVNKFCFIYKIFF